MRPQGRPSVRGRPGVQTPSGEAALQRCVQVQVEPGGVRQRREDVRQRVSAEGHQQDGSAAGAARHYPDPERSV